MPQIKPDRMCTQKDLEKALQNIGVKSGMVLMVHSSLGSLGWVPGGARSVVDALLDVLGPQGTLVMPAHSGENSDPSYWQHPPVPKDWWPAIRQAIPPFDPDRTPCRGMGAVVDCFRAYPGVSRSNHPTSSFLAKGPAAESLLARHDLDCCLGEASPCGALEHADAWVLLLGVDFDSCTVMHLAEYRSQCRTSFMQSSAVLKDGRIEFAPYPEIELDSNDFLEPGRQLEADGKVVRGKVSKSELRLFKVRDAVRYAENWLRQNRLHRLDKTDQERLMAYLRQEPEFNLFLIGDIENYGLKTDFMDVMAFEKDNEFDSILLRYHHSYLPYSLKPDFDPNPLLAALKTPNLHILSGKKSVLDRLRPSLEGFKWRDTYLMRLQPEDLVLSEDWTGNNGSRPLPENVSMTMAESADAPAIVDFLAGIAEFSRPGSRQEQRSELETALSKGSSHYYLFWHQGSIIATAGTSAENSLSAMVVAVATHPDWRGLGLASRLLAKMAHDLLPRRFQYLCLFYDNPDAGRIYRRLGYKDAGQWVMAMREEPAGE